MSQTNAPKDYTPAEKEQQAYRRCLSVLMENGRSREAAIAELGDHPGKPSNVDVERAKAAVAASRPLHRPGAGTKNRTAPVGSKKERKPEGEAAPKLSRGAKLLIQGEPLEEPEIPVPGQEVTEEDMTGDGTGEEQQSDQESQGEGQGENWPEE